MTDAQRSLYQAIESDDPLVLTLTPTAAEQLLAIADGANVHPHGRMAASYLDDSDDDGDADDDAPRDRAYALNSRARTAAEAFVVLNDKSGSRGDPIYEVAIQLDGIEGFVRFAVAAKRDCMLVIGVRNSFFPPPMGAVRWVGGISLSRSSDAMPRSLVVACDKGRDAKTIRSDVERNVRVWETFLEVQERDARERQYSVRYATRRTGDQPEVQRLTLEGVTPETIEKLRHSRDFLEVFARPPRDQDDSDWDSPLARVRVLKYYAESKVLEVRIDEDDTERLHRAANRMPSSGWLANRELGATVHISRQKSAIMRLRHGHARLLSLDQLLYGDDAFRPPDGAPVEPLAPERCLRPDRINDEQRAAVALALSTPDCFFLQGPPGTGKTTFIAELCYQAARSGKRVLVSSQTNLAVDNALSRLENQPEILATRLGNPKSVDDDGLPFVGERAVHRWLQAVADRASKNIRSIQDSAAAYRIVHEHASTLRSWSSRGCPHDDRPRPPIHQLAEELDKLRVVMLRARAACGELHEARRLTEDIHRHRKDCVHLTLRREQIEKTLRDGLTRASKEICQQPLTGIIDRIDALRKAADASDTQGKAEEGPLPAMLRAYCAAERDGSEAQAEAWLQQIEACLRHLRKKAGGFLFGWLHKHALVEARTSLTAAAGDLSSEVFAAGIPWPRLRAAFEAELETQNAALNTAAQQEQAANARLGALTGKSSTSALMNAARELQDRTSMLCASDPLHHFEAALERTREIEIDLENRLANAVWAGFSECEFANISNAVPSHRIANPTTVASALDRPNQHAPGRVDAAVKLLQEWSSYLTNNIDGIDAQMQSTFDRAVNVVGATCSMTASKQFLSRFTGFDIVIIDEVSKATATELLLPALLGQRVVLVGDHKQLNPMVGDDIEGDSYQDAADSLGLDRKQFETILSRSLFKERFERLHSLPGSHRTMMLMRQYRMHSSIMRGINQFYDGMLRLGTPDLDQYKQHGLEDLPWLAKDCHVVWIDLPDHPEWQSEQEAGSMSSVNPKEAEIVASVTQQLVPALQARGLSLGVISLYAGQSRMIRRGIDRRHLPKEARLGVSLRVSTVDRFQGTERDVVVVSLCANGRRPSAFLRTPNRVNVAMSRARRLLIIVGSSATFCRQHGDESHYGAFLKIARAQRGYLHAQELLESS